MLNRRQDMPELDEVEWGSRSWLVLVPLVFVGIAVWFFGAVVQLALTKHPHTAVGYGALLFGFCFSLVVLCVSAAITINMWRSGQCLCFR